MLKKLTNSSFLISAIVMAASLVLQSCGFHLRGIVELPPELESIYIEGGLPDSQMREILRQKLIASNVKVLAQREESAALLRILKDETTRRIASIDAAGQPNEYELKYMLSYQLEDGKGETLLGAKSLSQLRTYRYDPNNILSVEEEEFRIKKEMARAAVNQMLRQISAGMRHRNKVADGDVPAESMSHQHDPAPATPAVGGEPAPANPTVGGDPVSATPTVGGEPVSANPTVGGEPVSANPTVRGEPVSANPTVRGEPVEP